MAVETLVLSTATLLISEKFKQLQQFLKSTSFSRGILVGFAVTIPAVLGGQLGHFEVGLALSFGAFWSSPSDIVGSFRHKKISILIAASLVMLVSFIKGYLGSELWLLHPVLGLLTFIIAFISVYGFRASLISYSSLMALALIFVNSEELEIHQYAALIGVGGLVFTFGKDLASCKPECRNGRVIVGAYVLTAELLETRENWLAYI